MTPALRPPRSRGLAVAGLLALGTPLPGSASDIVDGHLPGRLTALAWFNAWGSVVFFDALGALAAIFPTGRLPAGRMGRLVGFAIGVPILSAIRAGVVDTARPSLQPSWLELSVREQS